MDHLAASLHGTTTLLHNASQLASTSAESTTSLSSSIVTWLLVALALALFLYHRSTTGNSNVKNVRLPPGPRQWPLIGNIGQVNPSRQHPQFLQWAKQYGAIFRLRFGSNDFVVLNTAQAAVDLLDRRSAKYSSRAGPHFAHDLMSAGQRMVFLPYASEWKVARASLHPYLMGTKSRSYRVVQEHESAVLMGDLLRHTRTMQKHLADGSFKTATRHEDGWEAHVRRYTTSVVLNITYGKRITSAYDNPSLHKIYDILANFTLVGQPGRNPCDDFPLLRKLPDWLSPWRAEALRLHKWEMQLWGGFMDQLKGEREALTSVKSYVNDMLEDRERNGDGFDGKGLGLNEKGLMSDTLLAYTAATVLEAGSDTTASSVYFFVLACLNDPEIMRKLQAEIDAAVPASTLPAFEHIEGLPYLRSCVKETLRRRPPTIMGIPHRVTQDDIYDGMLIKKDSIVIGNVWAMHMDPVRYPEPERFMPERFMGDSLSAAQSAATMDASRRDHYAFGWGRRVCQGMHIAEASLLIIFARLAWAFDLQAPPVEKEPLKSIHEESTYTDGFVSQTNPYTCLFVPRHAGVARVLASAYDDAQLFWAEQNREGDTRDGPV